MLKEQVGLILENLATLLELHNENPFKIRAYNSAAHALANLDADLRELVEQGKLTEIEGIGEAIAAKITEFVHTGHIALYEELKAKTPQGLIEMLRIPGLGPKKIYALYTALGIQSIAELETACLENRLVGLPGFGEKTQRKILHGIQILKSNQGKHLYSQALKVAEHIIHQLQKHAQKIAYAGSLRRFKELVKDIDLVAAAKDKHKLLELFTGLDIVANVIQQGENKASVETKEGINVDLLIVEEDEYPYALHHFTGSKEHNVELRSLAKSMQLKINEYGVFRDEQRLAAKDETEFFKIFGMSFIPPELREGTGEVEAARKGLLPELIEEEDLQGLFHVHTSYSDGLSGLRDLKAAAKGMGFKYMGISDHSQSAAYAGGLKSETVRYQAAQIEAINKEDKDFILLKGIESDILADGSLDYPDEILEKFDFVIGSVHSRFNMTEREMTQRLSKALKNRYLTILGHPTGRLLLGREGYAVDLEELLKVAAEHQKCIEINSNPHRLDLDWHWCRRAKELGVKIAINPDAHNIEELKYYKYGIKVAKKAWLTKDDVLNAMPVRQLVKYLKDMRKG